MKNFIVLAALCVLVSCSKNDQNQANIDEPNQENELQTCNFGITQFNLSKRDALVAIGDRKPNKPPRGDAGSGTGSGTGTTTPPPPPPHSSNAAVILLDFDGQLVSGTAWNGGATINCAPANLSSEAVGTIINRVANDYAPFNVIVTADESVFNAAASNRRMRVILTETWEWFGQAGGVALINTFTSGSNTPCFVFTSLLNYSEKNIAEAASHEAGHTFGLYHQAVYSGTTLTGQYNYGQGTGETGWAPIMGCGYNRNLTVWHNGPNSNGYNAYQDEVAQISSIAGLRADDHSNSFSNATSLSGTASGYINTSNDADFFTVNLGSSKTLSVSPASVGSSNAGANLDLVVNIYSAQGQLISTINDPAVLSVTTTLNAGQYYISVSTASNQYASTYGMLDRYTVSLN